MYASSSEQRTGASSWTTTPAAAAISAMRGAAIPVTDNRSGDSSATDAPSAASNCASREARGARTRTDSSRAPAMISSTGASATMRPRPRMMMWSAVCAISVIRCDEWNTVRRSAARLRASWRTHTIPSGSSPFTGSSRNRVAGSPSDATARPRRCPIPSEKPPTRLRATESIPVRPITSSTRRAPIRCVAAMARRWSRALRPGWMDVASSSAPTSRNGARCRAYGRPFTERAPAIGRSSPMIIRIVVDFPAPFGPRNPVTTPGRTVKSTPSTAALPP